MKKLILLFLIIQTIMALSACGSGDDTVSDGESDLALLPASIDASDEYEVALQPLNYEDGEIVESIYYRMRSQDDTTCYQVQPADAEEPMNLPLDETVIYAVEGDDCYLKRVNLDIGQDAAPVHISQYQLFVRLESNAVYTPDGASAHADDGR